MRQNYMLQIEEINQKLKEIETDDIIDKCQQSQIYLETKIVEINQWLRDYHFEDEASEIHYFKNCKSKIVAQLFYYQILLDSI